MVRAKTQRNARRTRDDGQLIPLRLTDLHVLHVGQVVLAPLRQDDGSGIKVRPCAIITVARTHVLVRPLTSSPLAPGRTALEIRYWKEAGLDRPSWALHREVSLSVPAHVQVIGELLPEDVQRLESNLVTNVAAWPA